MYASLHERDTVLTAGVLCSRSKSRRRWNRNKERTRWWEANQTSSQTRLGGWAAPQGVRGGEEQFETSSPPMTPFHAVPTPEMEPSKCVEGERRGCWGTSSHFCPTGSSDFSAPRPSAQLMHSLCYGSYGWGRLALSNGPLSWLWWYNLVEVWERESCWCSGMGGRFEWKIALIMMEETDVRSNVTRKLLAFRKNFGYGPFLLWTA